MSELCDVGVFALLLKYRRDDIIHQVVVLHADDVELVGVLSEIMEP